MAAFARTKQDILDSLGVVDYSPKGSVDKEIVPLINLVNQHPHFVTTSSCAGRVSVFIEGSKSPRRIGGKGDGGAWLFFTHDPTELQSDWVRGLREYEHPEPVDRSEPHRYVLYKFEPFILHVRCIDREAANRLYSVAMACGFRETGIGPHNLVAIRISMRLDVPIGYLAGPHIAMLVPADYLGELDRISLELFAKNNRRISELTEQIGRLAAENTTVAESKEARRARKRREGLQRQAASRVTPAPAGQGNSDSEDLQAFPALLA